MFKRHFHSKKSKQNLSDSWYDGKKNATKSQRFAAVTKTKFVLLPRWVTISVRMNKERPLYPIPHEMRHFILCLRVLLLMKLQAKTIFHWFVLHIIRSYQWSYQRESSAGALSIHAVSVHTCQEITRYSLIFGGTIAVTTYENILKEFKKHKQKKMKCTFHDSIASTWEIIVGKNK